MAKQLEQVRKEENRTRSELLREALRQYIENRYPVEKPTRTELAAIRRGRAAIKRGDFVSLTDVINELDTRHRKAGTKRPRKGSA
jgi:predicted transcriptional regulator